MKVIHCDYCGVECTDARVRVVVTDASVEGLDAYDSYERDVCVTCCNERLGMTPKMVKGSPG